MPSKEEIIKLSTSFCRGHEHDWPCPRCSKGILKIKEDTFSKEEISSVRDRNQDAWDPEWIEYVYSCLLHCNNSKCKEVVGCTGTGKVTLCYYEDKDGTEHDAHIDEFQSKFFEPPLNLINIPPQCPQSIIESLTESFRLFFASPAAAGNTIRITIEALLDKLNITKYTNHKAKRVPLKLHHRIEKLPPKYEAIKTYLLAIKWLGNAGSHAGQKLTHEDIAIAYKLIEHCIINIYDTEKKELKKVATSINKRKGPIKNKDPFDDI